MKITELIRTPDVSGEAEPESISFEPPTNADMAGLLIAKPAVCTASGWHSRWTARRSTSSASTCSRGV